VNKDVAVKLKEKAEAIAQRYSDPSRQHNGNAEAFLVEVIKPLSDTTASVTFLKSSGKRALAFFQWINMGEGFWAYSFPKDSDIVGMMLFGGLKQQVEELNFPLNFKEKG